MTGAPALRALRKPFVSSPAGGGERDHEFKTKSRWDQSDQDGSPIEAVRRFRPGDGNAWTSDRAVGHWLSGAPEDLPDVLETLSGAFDPIDLPREFAEREREGTT